MVSSQLGRLFDAGRFGCGRCARVAVQRGSKHWRIRGENGELVILCCMRLADRAAGRGVGAGELLTLIKREGKRGALVDAPV